MFKRMEKLELLYLVAWVLLDMVVVLDWLKLISNP